MASLLACLWNLVELKNATRPELRTYGIIIEEDFGFYFLQN